MIAHPAVNADVKNGAKLLDAATQKTIISLPLGAVKSGYIGTSSGSFPELRRGTFYRLISNNLLNLVTNVYNYKFTLNNLSKI
jgi:hypothetical protein